VNVSAIGTLPVVALADVGVAEIAVEGPAGGGEPGGTVVDGDVDVELPPPPQAHSPAAMKSARPARMTNVAASFGVFILVGSPRRPGSCRQRTVPRAPRNETREYG
jgi:hypothetical protein